jgi:hypothetical protein
LASNDEIFCSENRTGMSLGATVGIVVAGAFVIFLVLGILWWKCCLGQKNKMEQGTCKAINIVIIFFSKKKKFII